MKTHIPYYKLPFRIKLWWAKIFIQMFRGFSETIARIYSSWECEDADAELICDAGNTAQKCGLLPSELLQQRDELKEELAEQKRLYFKLFDEEISCMYCEAKIRRGSAIILCKECAENTEV